MFKEKISVETIAARRYRLRQGAELMATNWTTIDSDSRLSVCDLLSTALSNYVDNIADSHGNCVWDLSC